MKKLILLITLLFGIICYSQNDSISNLNTTQAERIIDKYSSKISESFNEGLNKITPVAEEGFKIAVKLQIAESIFYLVASLFLIIIILLLTCKKSIVEWILEVTGGGLYIIFVFILPLLGVVLYNGITRLIAPEWYAIKEIIELF